VLAVVVALVAATATAPPVSAAADRYFTGDFRTSLNLYSFNINLNAWVKNRKGVPPIDTLSAIEWAHAAGFEGVDVTSYYVPGYENYALPSKPAEEILAFARAIKEKAASLGIAVTGSGALNDFANPDPAAIALDVQRVEFWTDVAAEMGAPVMRVFSGEVPADLDAAGGWEAVTRQRIVPALKQVTAHAGTRGVKVLLQNHGDMTATADQTLKILDWVDSPNIGIIDDTGYFRPFQSPAAEGYDWYRDIAKVLSRTASIQVKRKPAGADSAGPIMDYRRLFTDLRLSTYRGYLPMERLWAKTDADNPRTLTLPPFEQVAAFLAEVRTALQETRTQPFDAVRADIARLGLDSPLRGRLYNAVSRADDHFRAGQPRGAMKRMEDFLHLLDDAPPDARAVLEPRMTALLQSFHDVFGDS
jgi:hydroxypyruvate isomerase